ncbi:MAG: pyruvate kinase [Phycisphaera sp.]|nr:pyruvate kinase [Phycisphaera sp.]
MSTDTSIEPHDAEPPTTAAAPGDAAIAWSADHLGPLIERVDDLYRDVRRFADEALARLPDIHETHRRSAMNLLHYVALRRRDIRALQRELAVLGLSSLGRSEPNVMANIVSVSRILHKLSDIDVPPGRHTEPPIALGSGRRLLEDRTRALLGPAREGRGVSIMVTMPTEAAESYKLVRELVAGGMDCMRINCAHDGPTAWRLMIENLRRAEAELGRTCKVLMDLGGPKLRTGPIEPGPEVAKWRPIRDKLGRVVTPARVWLYAEDAKHHKKPADADAALPVPRAWLDRLHPGETISFRDARGRKRRLKVRGADADGCWTECQRTAYVTPGTLLRIDKFNGEPAAQCVPVGDLPFTEQAITLRVGDTLMLLRDGRPGRPANVAPDGSVTAPACISCTLPRVLDDIKVGQPVWLDDGRITGVVESIADARVALRITRTTGAKGDKLRADKGINLPESDLAIAALTDKDIEDLGFVVQHADIVNVSFVRRPEDVRQLQHHLRDLGGENLGIMLKIETRQAFAHLPELLLTAMASPRIGVMIARGDLAVECGYERMAEVQEEMLWVCEAAHVPVVWATQVLETMAKTGQPSRAEVTDAAMSERAECVMLNKGPYILDAVTFLDGILRRMAGHQTKKSPMLRALSVAGAFAGSPA